MSSLPQLDHFCCLCACVRMCVHVWSHRRFCSIICTSHCLCILYLYFVHFVVPMGIFPWEIPVTFPKVSQLQTVSRDPTLINYNVHAGCFRVRNPPNSDMDYRIFNVRIRTGLGTPTASQHNIFDSEKLTNLSCAADGIRTSVLWISSPTLYQLSHPVTHHP